MRLSTKKDYLPTIVGKYFLKAKQKIVGLSVIDIHSPNIPTVEQMVDLIQKSAENISAERLWVNPDCGLKTRGWQETESA